MRRTAFTLVELMVVIAVLAILVLLLLPALNAARESARKAVCKNNLKQVTLAVHNSESSTKRYPIGAQGNGMFGHSWWVDVLPFLEEQTLYDELDLRSPHHGWILLNHRNAQAVDGAAISALHCPSSPLPLMEPIYALDVMMPSYVGIAGATSDNGFPETRVSTCCVASPGGEISAGGVLFPNAQIRLREVRDGLSKTIVVAEQSEESINLTSFPMRVDAGFPNGWLTGTQAKGTPPNYDPDETEKRASWNITTIRYPPNTSNYQLPGIYFDRGANNPLTSAHPGGVHAATLDGAVMFLPDDIDIEILKRLATRDDGLAIEEF